MSEDHVMRIPIKAGMAVRVRSHLEARAAQGGELDKVYAARGVTRNIAFVSQEAAEDVLFVYRSGQDLKTAGVKFLLEDSAVDRELARLFLEATHFDQATTLPVTFRWPPLAAAGEAVQDEQAPKNESSHRLASRALAGLIVDALVDAGLLRETDNDRAVAVATEEIDARKAVGDD